MGCCHAGMNYFCKTLYSTANFHCFLNSLNFFETWEVFQLSKTADSTYFFLSNLVFAKFVKENLLNMENCKLFAITKQRSLLRHRTAI